MQSIKRVTENTDETLNNRHIFIVSKLIRPGIERIDHRLWTEINPRFNLSKWAFLARFFLAKIIDLEQTVFHVNPVFIQAPYRIS